MALPSNINTSNRTLLNTSSIKFRNLVAKTAVDNLLQQNQVFFFAAHAGIEGTSGASAESSVGDEIIYENITVLERVTPTDVALCVPRINWESGRIYDAFNPYKNNFDYQVEFNGAIIYNKQPYVMTENYNVYVCIKNSPTGLDRDRVASTTEPTGIGTRPFQTADGYTWQYLYSISDELFKFLTTSWMPTPTPIKVAPTTGLNSAKYRQYQVQLAADTTKGQINDVDINIGNSNVYFDSPPHPQIRCTQTDNIYGVYYNSEYDFSLFAGKKYKNIEYGLVTGYSGGKILPMIRYKKDNFFIAPAYEISGNYGMVFGLEFEL
jgi:hypothetical protein